MGKVPKPKVEYRIVCNRYHESRARDANHRAHAYEKSTLEKALKMADDNANDPVFLNPTPDKVGCLPWHVEGRVVTEWEPRTEAEDLAEMLFRDWYDPPELWTEQTS